MVVRGNNPRRRKLAIKIISISGHQVSPGGACCEKPPQHFPYSYLLFLKTKTVPNDFENILWSFPGTQLNCTVIEQTKFG